MNYFGGIFYCLDIFLAQCGYCVGKWEALDIVDEGLNSEAYILSEYWSFRGRNVDGA